MDGVHKNIVIKSADDNGVGQGLPSLIPLEKLSDVPLFLRFKVRETAVNDDCPSQNLLERLLFSLNLDADRHIQRASGREKSPKHAHECLRVLFSLSGKVFRNADLLKGRLNRCSVVREMKMAGLFPGGFLPPLVISVHRDNSSPIAE